MANFFDQFDVAPPKPAPGGNFFDQFEGLKVSTPEAVALGAKSGATAGFYDELTGATEAGRRLIPKEGNAALDIMERLPLGNITVPVTRALAGGIGAAFDGLTGNGHSAVIEAYQAGRDRVRGMQKAARQQHPIAYGASELAGGLATVPVMPAVAAPKVAGLAGRAGAAALTGAGYGALSGAGEGEGVEDTAQRAATGAAIGGALGGVAAPIIDGVTAVGSKLFGGLTRKGREVEAARQVTGAVEKDNPGAANAVETAAQTLESAKRSGVPLIAADVGDTATRRLADAASIKSPGAQKALEEAFVARKATQHDRLLDQVRAIAGNVDSTLEREALERAASLANRPAYEAAMKAGANGVWSPELERLAGAPAIREAAQGAMPSLANRGIVEGFAAPRQNPLQWDRETGLASLTTLPNGNTRVPDLRFWDQVKKNLDGMIGKADRAGDKPRVAELTSVKNELVANLDQVVPLYKDARGRAARYFGAGDAMEAGEKFATSSMQNTEARQALAKMSQPERDLFARGFASDLIKTIREAPNPTNVINKIQNAPAALERIEIALGPNGARRLEAFARLENIMRQTKDAVTGNSKTAQRLVDAGIISGGLGFDLANGQIADPTSIGTWAVIGALTKAGRRQINEKVAEQVGKLLASSDPQALRNALDMAVRNPRLLDAVRRADNLVSKTLAITQPSPGRFLGPAQSRADDQQDAR